MNPSFKPPTPLSDKTRTQIFNFYIDEKMGELELSSRYGLGVSRIRAILRLKKLEQLWIKVNFLIPLVWNRDEHQWISLEDYYMVKKRYTCMAF